MKALVFDPGEEPVIVTGLNGFEGIRTLIGGHIERIRLNGDSSRGVSLWCDEDGIAKGLTPNLTAIGPTYRGALIYGTAVVCGYRCVLLLDDVDEVVCELSLGEMEYWASTLPRYGASALGPEGQS